MRSPITHVIRELERAFAFLNAFFCGNTLPENVLITVENGLRRNHRGEFRVLRIRRRRTYAICIAFNEVQRGAEAVLEVLLHEMVHLRNHLAGLPDTHKGYHNRHFRDMAAVMGLKCGRGSTYGYMATMLNDHGKAALGHWSSHFSLATK